MSERAPTSAKLISETREQAWRRIRLLGSVYGMDCKQPIDRTPLPYWKNRHAS